MAVLMICNVSMFIGFVVILVGLGLGIWGRWTAESDPFRSVDRSLISIICSVVGLIVVMLAIYISFMETNFIVYEEMMK